MPARAAVTDGNGNFSFEDIEVGRPQTGEILVEIKASGVCHTDVKSLYWKRPLILGHEGAGIVREIGPGVTHVVPGDRVLLNWAMPCEACASCRRGLQNVCENPPVVPSERFRCGGKPIEPSFHLGTMSPLTVVPRQAVVKIDVEIPFSSACLLGCGVMTGFGSVHNVAKVEEGSSVAVLGTGGVGLSVIQGARIARAGMIIGLDLHPAKLRMAESFGATHTVPADRKDEGLLEAAKKVKALTGGRGADYAFECMSVPALAASPLAMIRNGGTAVGISGIEQVVPFDATLFEWDKIYINPLYGRCRPAIDFPRLLRLYKEGLLKLDEMVTRTYPLERLAAAFEDLHRGANAKGVLLLST